MFGRSGTRWLAPNRYNSLCVRCQQPVPAGTGEFRYDGERWVVRHPGGECHTVAYTQYVSQESLEWQRVRHARMQYAGHRCEWRGLFSGRCRVSWPLQCHHRHYRNLGAEPLADVVILCVPHHEIADDRRRFWGSWPLIGHPFWGPSIPIMDTPTEMKPVPGPPSGLPTQDPPRSTRPGKEHILRPPV
jgi:hypothetical protein